MATGVAAYGLSFAAGALSTLSPCVLPIVPILLGTAVAAHRFGPLALSGGLALSFTAVGVVLASVGTVVGLDQPLLRQLAAIVLIGLGAVMLSARLQARFAGAAAGVSGVGQRLLARMTLEGLAGQFALGLLLGLVWSPCVGPTLGAAITLASQRENLAHVALSMALFGVGAGLPLVVLGLASRQAAGRLRGSLLTTGRVGRQVLGITMLLLGFMIVSGLDKRIETWALDSAPGWLVDLTTSI